VAGGDFRLVAEPGKPSIVMTRNFAAPRLLVFEALSKPELVRRWLLGPPGWTMPECDIDFRVGGRYRYLWRHEPDGAEMGMGGVYREILAPSRIVATEKFDQSWYPGEALDYYDLAERAWRTMVTLTVIYESFEVRDAVLKSPMEQGVAMGFDRLEEVLASMGGPTGGRT
jgi:uncharacterized protein YndB with AHSA1/START domain